MENEKKKRKKNPQKRFGPFIMLCTCLGPCQGLLVISAHKNWKPRSYSPIAHHGSSLPLLLESSSCGGATIHGWLLWMAALVGKIGFVCRLYQPQHKHWHLKHLQKIAQNKGHRASLPHGFADGHDVHFGQFLLFIPIALSMEPALVM